jgi:hypothetical protein
LSPRKAAITFAVRHLPSPEAPVAGNNAHFSDIAANYSSSSAAIAWLKLDNVTVRVLDVYESAGNALRIEVHPDIIIPDILHGTVEIGIVYPEAEMKMSQAAFRQAHPTISLEEKKAVHCTCGLHVHDTIGTPDDLHVEQVGVEPDRLTEVADVDGYMA